VQAALVGLLASAPDLDLLVGRHSRETHSLGAAVIAASVAAWRRWPFASTPARIWIVVFAAWLSHPVLDALSVDRGEPIGVMLFWPFSSQFFHFGVDVFGAIERHWEHEGFVRQNVLSVLREIAILGPIAAIAGWGRRRHRGKRDLRLGIDRPNRRF
jgi:hypothetical protein